MIRRFPFICSLFGKGTDQLKQVEVQRRCHARTSLDAKSRALNWLRAWNSVDDGGVFFCDGMNALQPPRGEKIHAKDV
jgi:hypothetical protein